MKQALADAIVSQCIEYADSQDHLLFGKETGARYMYQFYLSRILYSPYWLKSVANYFSEIVITLDHLENFDFQIAGREWSAIPLLIAIPYYMEQEHGIHLNSFMIKRKRKTYGIHNYIEGTPTKQKVLLVDDICNSTNSYLHCKKVIETELGLPVCNEIFAVLNKTVPEDYPKTFYYDKYLGPESKVLSIVDGGDVENAFRRTKHYVP